MYSKNIYWETRPIFMVSSFFGVSPYTPKFKLSILNLSFSILILTATLADGLFLSYFMESVNYTYKFSSFSLMLERFQLIMVVTSVVFSVSKACFNSKNLSFVMEEISKVDIDLKGIGIMFTSNRNFSTIVTVARMIIVSTLFVCDMVLLNVHQTFGMILVEYICFVPLVIINLIQVQFMSLLHGVQKRLSTMTSFVNKTPKKFYTKKTIFDVIISSFNTLVDLCSIINSLYSIQILLILSSIFIITTANLYHVIERLQLILSEHGSDNDLSTICLLSYRITVRSMEIWTLVTCCCNTVDKLQEFTNSIYKFMLNNNLSEHEMMKLQMHITMKKNLVFTAYGFFSLDYTLVHSMIAAATTYLVILLQFSAET